MSGRQFNEAERFLLTTWGEAESLEASMNAVRTKYESMFNRVLEQIKVVYPQLDAAKTFLRGRDVRGSMVFGRSTWGRTPLHSQSGFWMEHLALKHLTADDSDPLKSSIWVSRNAVSAFDFNAARASLISAANRVLSGEQLTEVKLGDGEYLLYFASPSKSELRAALYEGDGEDFVGVVVNHFEMMFQLLPAVDELFADLNR